MKELWDSADAIVDKWIVLRSALYESAATILGKACRRQPDWFKNLFCYLCLKRERYFIINGLVQDLNKIGRSLPT